MVNERVLKGIIFGILCFLSISVMQVMMKYLAPKFGTEQIMFFRCFFCLMICMGYYKLKHNILIPKTQHFSLHFVRFIAVVIGLSLTFMSIKIIPFAEFTVLGFTFAFFVLILSSFLLKEHVGLHRAGAVFIGFVGVLIILQPGVSALMTWGGLLNVFAQIFIAYAFILNKKLADLEDAVKIVFMFSALGMLYYGAFLPFQWKTPGFEELQVLFGFGVVGFLVQYFLTKSLAYAPSVVISPIKYMNLLWNIMWGYLLWNEIPQNYFWYGAALIVSSNLYLIYRDATRKKVALA